MFHKNTSPPYSCSAAGSCGSGGTVSSSDKSRPHNEKFFGWPRKTPDCGREGYLARLPQKIMTAEDNKEPEKRSKEFKMFT